MHQVLRSDAKVASILFVIVIASARNRDGPDGPPYRPSIIWSAEIDQRMTDRERIILRQSLEIRLDSCDILKPSFLGVLGLGDAAEVGSGIDTNTVGWKRRSLRGSLPLAFSPGEWIRHDMRNALVGMFDKAEERKE